MSHDRCSHPQWTFLPERQSFSWIFVAHLTSRAVEKFWIEDVSSWILKQGPLEALFPFLTAALFLRQTATTIRQVSLSAHESQDKMGEFFRPVSLIHFKSLTGWLFAAWSLSWNHCPLIIHEISQLFEESPILHSQFCHQYFMVDIFKRSLKKPVNLHVGRLQFLFTL